MDKDKLNPRQEQFCQLYAGSGNRDFFGNGVQTYIEIYAPDQSKPNWYQNARASASEILTNPNVFNRINELLDQNGFNDTAVDAQLKFLIDQHGELSAKLGAIREYNKLKQRIVDRIDHTTNGKDLPTPIYGSKSTDV